MKSELAEMAEFIRKNLDIDLRHLTRVEGHGNIVINVRDGVLVRCALEVVEAPRYFEAILHGYPFQQAPSLVSRICGICAVAHTTTSLRAIEKALGVEPSLQTKMLRNANFLAEILDSHILHAYMLVIPDLVGAGSAISLAKTSPDVVARALRIKKMAGEICRVICGRHTHPIAMTVGGFSHLPSEAELVELYEDLEAMLPDIDATVELFNSLIFPDFERETEFIALTDDEYCFIDGALSDSTGDTWAPSQYSRKTKEVLVSHSAAKHAEYRGQPYMVGALARINLNHGKLHPIAQQVASEFKLLPKCNNPFKITLAQVVEIVHCYYESILIIKQLLDMGLEKEEPVQPDRLSGEGVGACEAPRGTLYHHYVIENGSIRRANCIIPTAQNLANIEMDMRAAIPKYLNKSDVEITHLLEMLVRAYDPCISCSTHALEVKFV
jgi:coenzyme F420-reducing hydrogenase alpha subunit